MNLPFFLLIFITPIMGIIDEVKHQNLGKTEETTERKEAPKDQEAKSLTELAAQVLRPPFSEYLGCAASFFYKTGIDHFTFVTFADTARVPESVAIRGAKEFNVKLMQSYGHPAPAERKKR